MRSSIVFAAATAHDDSRRLLRLLGHVDRGPVMMWDVSSAELRELGTGPWRSSSAGLPEATLFPSDLIGFPRSLPKAPPSEQLDDFLVGSLAEVGIVKADSVERLWRRQKNHLVAFFL